MFNLRVGRALFLVFLAGCIVSWSGCRRDREAATAASPRVTFVRGGVAIEGYPGQAEVRRDGERISARRQDLDGDRQLLLFGWRPGEALELFLDHGWKPFTAPLKPTPYLIRTIPLDPEGMTPGTVPDSCLAFDPGGYSLAIGTLTGSLQVVDVFTGRTLWAKKVAEGMVKRVAFSPDGSVLYAGEQSVDGNLYAFEARTGKRLWSYRIADDIETGQPPARDDRYGIYSLPGVYQIRVTHDGRIVAAGTHSWVDEGVRKNRSRIYVFAADGTLVHAWPSQGTLDATVTEVTVDASGSRALIACSRSATTPPTGPVRGAGIYLLDLEKGTLLWGRALEPLKPHFSQVFIWEAASLSPDGTKALAGLGDGRVMLFDVASSTPTGTLLKTLEPGVPVEISGVPLATPIGYSLATPRGFFFQTTDTNIPSGTEASGRTPPAPHPAARTLYAIDAQGRALWQYRGGFTPAGIWTDDQFRILMETTANPVEDHRRDRHGFMLFDISSAVPTKKRPIFMYNTEGPVFFHAALSHNGFLAAVTEMPALESDQESVYGRWQVHIVH